MQCTHQQLCMLCDGGWGPAQERDAEVAELQEQLAQLRALEQERGLPTPGTSDTPRVIAAQLHIEQLQRQLRKALHVRPHCHACSFDESPWP